MADLIDRQAALTAIRNMYPGAPIITKDAAYFSWKEKYEQFIMAEQAIKRLPSAQPSCFSTIEPLTPELRAGAEIVINAIISRSSADDQKKAEWKKLLKIIHNLPNGIMVPVRKGGSSHE